MVKPPARTHPTVASKPVLRDDQVLVDEPSKQVPNLMTDSGSCLEPVLLAWLTHGHPDVNALDHAQKVAQTQDTLASEEKQALARVDRLIADPVAHKRLLPRTAALVPQLLARLRDPHTDLPTLQQQVARDVGLVAEVLRMANGSLYAKQEAVVALDHAIALLGTDGLRVAIARTLLQPLIEAREEQSLAACMQRLWLHADKKAQLCAALVKAQGLPAFDGYLLALAHDAAWSAALRCVHGAHATASCSFHPGYVSALALRRDKLFAIIAVQWQLGPGSLAAAAAIGKLGLGQAPGALPQLLSNADSLASILCLGPARANEQTRQRLLGFLSVSPAQVQAVFAALQDAEK
jgi:HDOD domain